MGKTPTRAFELSSQACEYKEARGCTNLGYMYRQGLGVKENKITACSYSKIGCDMGNDLGCKDYAKFCNDITPTP